VLGSLRKLVRETAVPAQERDHHGVERGSLARCRVCGGASNVGWRSGGDGLVAVLAWHEWILSQVASHRLASGCKLVASHPGAATSHTTERNEMPLTPHQENLMKAAGYGDEAITELGKEIDAGDVEMRWDLIQQDHPEVTE
jgi:hypothetical protein